MARPIVGARRATPAAIEAALVMADLDAAVALVRAALAEAP